MRALQLFLASIGRFISTNWLLIASVLAIGLGGKWIIDERYVDPEGYAIIALALHLGFGLTLAHFGVLARVLPTTQRSFAAWWLVESAVVAIGAFVQNPQGAYNGFILGLCGLSALAALLLVANQLERAVQGALQFVGRLYTGQLGGAPVALGVNGMTALITGVIGMHLHDSEMLEDHMVSMAQWDAWTFIAAGGVVLINLAFIVLFVNIANRWDRRRQVNHRHQQRRAGN